MYEAAKGPTKEPWKSQFEERKWSFIGDPAVVARIKAFEAIDRTCPRCGGEIDEHTDNFCTFCRLDLRPMKTTCGGCGFSEHSWMTPEAYKPNYCPTCGAPWDEEHTIAPSVTPEALRISLEEAAQA
jgi:predicted amidophosphoribosyltransferase